MHECYKQYLYKGKYIFLITDLKVKNIILNLLEIRLHLPIKKHDIVVP